MKSEMAKKYQFEVRPRGEFMPDGKLVYAENSMMAMHDPLGGNNFDCVVILSDDNADDGNWWVITAAGVNCLSGKNDSYGPNPYNTNIDCRLEFAVACESAMQKNEKKSSLEFAHFGTQRNNYKQKQHTEIAIIKSTMCQKECLLAETATINKQLAEAGLTLSYALKLFHQAEIEALHSKIKEATEPNTAEKAVASAQKQYLKTFETFTKVKSKKTSIKQNEILEMSGLY